MSSRSASKEESFLQPYMSLKVGSEQVRILVGPESQEYCVHIELLKSEDMNFFGAVNKIAPYKLLDVDIATFDAFIPWLYTRDITIKPNRITLMNLWVFGAKIECNELKNYALDRIQDDYLAAKEWMDINEVKHLFEKTRHIKTGNALVTFASAMLNCYCISEEIGLNYVHDILQEVPEALHPYLQFQSDNQDFYIASYDPSMRNTKDLCVFHTHGRGEVCRSSTNVPDED